MTAQQLYLQLTETRNKAIYIIQQYCKTNPHIFTVPLAITRLSIEDGIELSHYITKCNKRYITVQINNQTHRPIQIDMFSTDILCAVAAFIEDEQTINQL